MKPISACLWFDGNAATAVNRYLSIFKTATRTVGSEYGEVGPGEAGSPMMLGFEVDGREFLCLNGGPMYSFTPAISFVINCADQDEVDYYWDRLLDGGVASQCGWLDDRFGVSWQIVPDRLMELLGDPDREAADRAMAAMLKMIKLDIPGLESAFRGD